MFAEPLIIIRQNDGRRTSDTGRNGTHTCGKDRSNQQACQPHRQLIDYKKRKDIIRPHPVGQDPRMHFIERIQSSPYHKENGRNGNKQISSEQGRELSLLLILRRMITLHITLVYTIVLQIGKYAINQAHPKSGLT